jgi:hypothetical protein
MNKWYGTFHAARHQPDGGGESADRYLWAFWFWQIDADPLHQPFGRAPVRQIINVDGKAELSSDLKTSTRSGQRLACAFQHFNRSRT